MGSNIYDTSHEQTGPINNNNSHDVHDIYYSQNAGHRIKWGVLKMSHWVLVFTMRYDRVKNVTY